MTLTTSVAVAQDHILEYQVGAAASIQELLSKVFHPLPTAVPHCWCASSHFSSRSNWTRNRRCSCCIWPKCPCSLEKVFWCVAAELLSFYSLGALWFCMQTEWCAYWFRQGRWSWRSHRQLEKSKNKKNVRKMKLLLFSAIELPSYATATATMALLWQRQYSRDKWKDLPTSQQQQQLLLHTQQWMLLITGKRLKMISSSLNWLSCNKINWCAGASNYFPETNELPEFNHILQMYSQWNNNTWC